MAGILDNPDIKSQIDAVMAGTDADSADLDDEFTVDASQARADSQDALDTSDTDSEISAEAELSPGTKDSLDTETPAVVKKSKESTPDTEEITITDDKGRRKIKIDLSDRDKNVKAHKLAYGARKWQAERDSERTSHAATKAERDSLKENWTSVEAAYRDKGVAGLVNLIEGKEDAYSAYEKSILSKYEARKGASADELDLLDSREREEKLSREISLARRENETTRAEITKEREAADMAALESQVNPTFERHRFAGRLGDKDDEHAFDTMLWNTAMDRLLPYETKGLLTQARIDAEFREVATRMRKRMQVQSDKSATRSADDKKTAVAAKVQSVAAGKVSGASSPEEVSKLTPDNLGSFFRSWGKNSERVR